MLIISNKICSANIFLLLKLRRRRYSGSGHFQVGISVSLAIISMRVGLDRGGDERWEVLNRVRLMGMGLELL